MTTPRDRKRGDEHELERLLEAFADSASLIKATAENFKTTASMLSEIREELKHLRRILIDGNGKSLITRAALFEAELSSLIEASKRQASAISSFERWKSAQTGGARSLIFVATAIGGIIGAVSGIVSVIYTIYNK